MTIATEPAFHRATPRDNAAQRNSPTYRLAALDVDFMLRDSMRGVRFLLEYAKPEEALRAWGVRSTIVVFGSARIRCDESGYDVHRRTHDGRRTRWYDEARRFGRIASERGGALHGPDRPRDNVIATGGGGGIMEAANRGAWEVGAPTIGFNITLPREQEPNAYTTPELTFRFHYFAMRKMHLAMRANALVVFPGGFGTLDELFELLTLRQTGKIAQLPIVLFDRSYWTRIVNFEALVEEGMIEPGDLTLFDFADDAEEAWQMLVRRGLKTYPPPVVQANGS
ncbi:MAG TPA: LOG family protein [Alphaproteobacteria bacterium]